MTLVSITITACASVESGWFGHGFARWQGQVHPTEGREPALNDLAKILRAYRRTDALTNDFSRLLLHRPAMLSRPDSQSPLQVVVEVADGNTRRDSSLHLFSIVIIDCNAIKSG